jgi:hypothetical protein
LDEGGLPRLGDLITHPAVVAPTTIETRHLSTVMTATLSAELKGAVPVDLVSDIVRAVLDERMQVARDRGLDPPILEARRRLERLIRARSTRRTWADRPRAEV